MNNIDWVALSAVYACSVPEPRPTPDLKAVVLRVDSETELELAQERAAIMEFEGELSRVEAETYAFRNI